MSLTDERLNELKRIPLDVTATKTELRNAIDELLYHYRIILQENQRYKEALERIAFFQLPEGEDAEEMKKIAYLGLKPYIKEEGESDVGKG